MADSHTAVPNLQAALLHPLICSAKPQLMTSGVRRWQRPALAVNGGGMRAQTNSHTHNRYHKEPERHCMQYEDSLRRERCLRSRGFACREQLRGSHSFPALLVRKKKDHD